MASARAPSSPLADVVATSPERDGGPTSPPHGLIGSTSPSRPNLQQTVTEADGVVVPVSPGALGRHDDVGMQAVSAVQSVCSGGDIGGGGGSVDSVAASEACEVEEAQPPVVSSGSDANTTVPVTVVVSDAAGAPPVVTRLTPGGGFCEEILEEPGGSACHVDSLKVEGDESSDVYIASPRCTDTAPVSPLDGVDPHLPAWSATGEAVTSLDHDSKYEERNPARSEVSPVAADTKDASARLVAEGSLFDPRAGSEGWMRGGVGAGSSSKFVIICDQGFKPKKSMEVPVGAMVSIRNPNVLGGANHFRQRVICLVGPKARDCQVSIFVPCCIKANSLSTYSTVCFVIGTWYGTGVVVRRNVHAKADIALFFLCDGI